MSLVAGFVVLVTLSAWAPPAGAQDASQNWYASGDAHATVTNGLQLRQGDSSATNSRTISTSAAATFAADQAAQATVDFGSGAWTLTLHWRGTTGSAYTITAKVGSLTTAGTFTEAGSATSAPTAATGGDQSITLSPDPASNFVVATGDWLGLQISHTNTLSGTLTLLAASGTDTTLASPAADPGYPAWQLGSAILLAAGLALVGAVVLRRRA